MVSRPLMEGAGGASRGGARTRRKADAQGCPSRAHAPPPAFAMARNRAARRRPTARRNRHATRSSTGCVRKDSWWWATRRRRRLRRSRGPWRTNWCRMARCPDRKSIPSPRAKSQSTRSRFLARWSPGGVRRSRGGGRRGGGRPGHERRTHRHAFRMSIARWLDRAWPQRPRSRHLDHSKA